MLKSQEKNDEKQKIIDDICARIRQVREAQNKTQSAFARILDTSKQNMWEYENRRLPPLKVLIKFSKLTNISLDWLFTGEGSNEKSEGSLNTNKLLAYLENIGIKSKEDMEGFFTILQGYLGLEAYETLIALIEKRSKRGG